MTQRSVAIVTGGGSGIGAATVHLLASRGVSTLVADLDVDAAERVAREASASTGARATGLRCDVTNPDDHASAVAEVESWEGTLDTLVCCAGNPGASAHLQDLPLETWDFVNQVNLMGVVHAIRAVSPTMRRHRRGSIVTVASIAGLTGSRAQVAYSTAKAGVVGLTRSAAKELMREGVRVNAVAPGFIQTPMTDALPDSARETWRVDRVTVEGRLGRSEEVAAGIDFLCSDAASYITGQVLTVDGGFTLGWP